MDEFDKLMIKVMIILLILSISIIIFAYNTRNVVEQDKNEQLLKEKLINNEITIEEYYKIKDIIEEEYRWEKD